MNKLANNIMLECKNISKNFDDGKNQLKVLNNVNLQIKCGAQIAIMGRSGSGKTTLLQLLGGLDNPTSGQVIINGQNILHLSETERGLFRNKSVGFIYQLHHLLPEFSALENVAMPLLIANVSAKQALAKAASLIDLVGLSARLEHRPAQLSGGERQRIAIARSLATDPECVLADEPTGNLDAENAELAFELMRKLNRERGTTFIVVTHDPDLAARMDHTYYIKNGNLE